MRILFTLVLASILTGCGRNCASLAEEQLGKKPGGMKENAFAFLGICYNCPSIFIAKATRR